MRTRWITFSHFMGLGGSHDSVDLNADLKIKDSTF